MIAVLMVVGRAPWGRVGRALRNRLLDLADWGRLIVFCVVFAALEKLSRCRRALRRGGRS